MNQRPRSLEEALAHYKNATPEQRAARQKEMRDQSEIDYAAQVKQRRLEQCRSLSEIKERFAERTFETFEQAPGNAQALAVAKDVAEDPAAGVYFWGAITGNGKSHLAGAIVNRCIASGVEAVFTTGVRLLMRIRNTYRGGHLREGELDIVDRLIRVPVLVLDDLGTEKFTEDTARLFYALVNGRYEGKQPMIVTSNLSLADLGIKWARSGAEEHLGVKIVDRLREMCTFKVEVTEPSHRRAAVA